MVSAYKIVCAFALIKADVKYVPKSVFDPNCVETQTTNVLH